MTAQQITAAIAAARVRYPDLSPLALAAMAYFEAKGTGRPIDWREYQAFVDVAQEPAPASRRAA